MEVELCQVKGHGKLHRAQVGSQMASRHTYFIDEKLPDFRRQRLIVPWVYIFDVIFFLYLIEKHNRMPPSIFFW